MDSPEPAERNEIYAEYKANREEMPDDLRPQIAMIVSRRCVGLPTAIPLSTNQGQDNQAPPNITANSGHVFSADRDQLARLHGCQERS